MAEASCCPDFGMSWGQWQPCWVLRVQSLGSTGWDGEASCQKGVTGRPHIAHVGQPCGCVSPSTPRHPKSGSGLGLVGPGRERRASF